MKPPDQRPRVTKPGVIVTVGALAAAVALFTPPPTLDNPLYTADFDFYVHEVWAVTVVTGFWLICFAFLRWKIRIAVAGLLPLLLAVWVFVSFSFEAHDMRGANVVASLCNQNLATDGSARCSTGAAKYIANHWNDLNPDASHSWRALPDATPRSIGSLYLSASSLNDASVLTVGKVAVVQDSFDGKKIVLIVPLTLTDVVQTKGLTMWLTKSERHQLFAPDYTNGNGSNYSVYGLLQPGQYLPQVGDIVALKGVIAGASRLTSQLNTSGINYNTAIICSSMAKVK